VFERACCSDWQNGDDFGFRKLQRNAADTFLEDRIDAKDVHFLGERFSASYRFRVHHSYLNEAPKIYLFGKATP